MKIEDKTIKKHILKKCKRKLFFRSLLSFTLSERHVNGREVRKKNIVNEERDNYYLNLLYCYRLSCFLRFMMCFTVDNR